MMAMKRCKINSTEEESMEKSPSEAAQVVKTVHKSVSMFKFDRWLDLSPDILELIMKRLPYIDLINFRAVCKSWNSVNRGKKVITPLIHQYPWLVNFDETAISTLPSLVNRTSCSCQLFDPTYKNLYTIDMSHIHNFCIGEVYESKYGWLLMSPPSSKYMLFAYTPFSSVNNFIELPTFDDSRRIAIDFATFTSNPSMDQDCLFIVLHNHQSNTTTPYNSTIGISTCRRGDKSWSARYLKYSSPVSLWANLSNETTHWIYSEGSIYNMVLPKQYYGTPRSRIEEYYEGYIPNRYYGTPSSRIEYCVRMMKLLEPKRIVKWPEVVKSHGTDGESLYGSFMELDDEDHDDSKYWVSKLRKEFSDLIYECPYTSDCDYGIWDDMQGQRKILKIDPPPHF